MPGIRVNVISVILLVLWLWAERRSSYQAEELMHLKLKLHEMRELITKQTQDYSILEQTSKTKDGALSVCEQSFRTIEEEQPSENPVIKFYQQREEELLREKLKTTSLKKFNQAKFAHHWLLTFYKERNDGGLAFALATAQQTARVFKPDNGKGTSWTCYELSQNEKVSAFNEIIAAGSVCVFKNFCLQGTNFLWIIGDNDSHKSLNLPAEQPLNWPQTCNGNPPFVSLHPVPDIDKFFEDNRVHWEENFSWIIRNSYPSHTAHWFENVANVFNAKYYLGNDIIPEAEKVYLLTHDEDLFDWQEQTLLTSLNQSRKPKIIMPKQISGSQTKCFKEVAIPGYQLYFFPTREAGVAYKHSVYRQLGLEIGPVPKKVTIASRSGRRSLVNEAELVNYIKNEYNLPVAVVRLGSMSFKDQVAAMHDTGLLIGLHGADLANLIFLPENAALIELNPYRFYEHRFWGMAPLAGIEYFSYNCGTSACSPDGIRGLEIVKEWPISGYPPATENMCRKEMEFNNKRDSRTKIVLEDFDFVLREALGYLRWGPLVPESFWNIQVDL